MTRSPRRHCAGFGGSLALSLILAPLLLASGPMAAPPEIHAKRFFRGYPTGTPLTNDLIKLANWVAYRRDASLMDCTVTW